MELLIGSSQPIRKIKEIIDQVVDSDLNVLIYGESGVGKELVARTLHARSYRSKKPLVKVNCAALPGELLESELFGYEKGAFTGAVKSKPGKFELANGGTIFLDEIGDMSVGLQAKLLQVLQDGVFSRIGAVKDIEVDCWVISATNQDLDLAIQKGSFREDLLYRLNVITITVPPLRDRLEDIPILVEHFIKKYGKVSKKGIRSLPSGLMEIFSSYHWPGNVRELENYVKRYLVFGDEDFLIAQIQSKMAGAGTSEDYKKRGDFSLESTILSRALKDTEKRLKSDFPPLKEIKKNALAHIEKIVIEEALKRTRGNKKKAANLLQISYKALLYKMKDFNVQVPGESSADNISLQVPPELDT